MYINSLVDDLRELEPKTTVRVSRAEAADGKNFAALEALQSAGRLVEEPAGWAFDHQIGLALSELKFVPRQPSGTRDHPDYLRIKPSANARENLRTVDDFTQPGPFSGMLKDICCNDEPAGGQISWPAPPSPRANQLTVRG